MGDVIQELEPSRGVKSSFPKVLCQEDGGKGRTETLDTSLVVSGLSLWQTLLHPSRDGTKD